jgi:[ribosomal protein S18]-alanine N-acetyltransferase
MSVHIDVLSAPVDPADRSSILALESASQQRPLSWAGIATELDDGTGVAAMFVARDAAGAVVGHASARRFVDDVHVIRLVVDGAVRRQGIGAALLDRLTSWARATGAARITLEVRAGNVAALALYGRAGFVTLGRRTGYYPDGEDAFVCSCEFAATRRIPVGGH